MKTKNQMTENQELVKNLIANDKTGEAIKILSQFFEKYDLPDLADSLTLQSGKWKAWKGNQIDGTLSFEKLNEEKAKIDKALLKINRELFEQIATIEQKKGKDKSQKVVKGIPISRFKNHLFFTVIFIKIIAFSWILFHFSTGGKFTNNTVLAAIGVLLPLFLICFWGLLRHYLNNEQTGKISATKFVKNSVRYVVYGLLLIYFYFQINFISQYATGEIVEIKNLVIWLLILEVILGSGIWALVRKW